ncbi:MAG TPA: competence/damage-inducible protein A [Ruminococcaceae bacterium]|jgi:nicotinamide-nucleotide amidase|nr:competence/damage-inducible protein A [Oscillospiraceae bacterium]HBG55992.1 competence/damage-inducible protein A [Oscillospiraceae bacterium]HBT91729.1 competence/damage-inducible protein A [Oscillospiraceae bacterium]HCB91566.1 competence/damage-inducible protein A [Oscillospiraceae bacterium]
MNAEIISVGTELLLGHTVNTDASLVARELAPAGIGLLYTCTVGDNPGRLRAALQTALERSDIVITTGGLGPTGDDLTKETVAAVAGKKLVMDRASMERIERYFQGRSLGETQKKQALLPEGCTVFPNDVGTAPGCGFRTASGKLVAMLPGPPSELVPMLRNYAVPFLAAGGHAAIVSHMVHVFGLGEGHVAEQIADLCAGANPTCATYAKECEMFVRVTARAQTPEQAEALCGPAVAELRKRLGAFVYGVDVASLEEAVVRLLTERRLTVATAESCTGGLVAKRITDIPGSSEVFHLGAVTYSNKAKQKLLGVPEATLRQYGAVSPQTARAMAKGVRALAGADFGLGVTGIAGPGGGTPQKPVGLVYLALSDGENVWVREMHGNTRRKGRGYQREMAASNALDMVRRRILNLGGIEDAAYSREKRGG